MADIMSWFQTTTLGRAAGDAMLGVLVLALCVALYLYDTAQYNARMGYTRPRRRHNRRRARG